jgi:hypothetical protein
MYDNDSNKVEEVGRQVLGKFPVPGVRAGSGEVYRPSGSAYVRKVKTSQTRREAGTESHGSLPVVVA